MGDEYNTAPVVCVAKMLRFTTPSGHRSSSTTGDTKIRAFFVDKNDRTTVNASDDPLPSSQ